MNATVSELPGFLQLPHREERGSAGYSMVELVVASVLLSMLIFSVATLSVSGGEAQEYSRRVARVTEVTQDLLGEIRLELVSSARVFGNDAEGNANLAVFDTDGAPAPLADLRLPRISATGTIGADVSGAEITGNSLLFTKLSWSDRFVCTSGNEYLVDVFRWVYYYLTPEDGGPDLTNAIGLNLVRIESEPLIDAAGVDRITDATDQEEFLVHLATSTPDANGATHPAAEVVWIRGQLPSDTDTFRQVDPSDGSMSSTPFGGRPDPWEVLRAPGDVCGVLSYRHHSVASIYARDAFGVGAFGIESTTGTGFPHGLEVQVVGPSAARQVLVHLVCCSTQRRGHTAYCDMMLSIDVRDL
ncbi:MAG: hypothetical protein AB8H80_13950 [Planctomycetota bacterium]